MVLTGITSNATDNKAEWMYRDSHELQKFRQQVSKKLAPAAVDVIASNHSVLDVSFHGVVLIQHGADASLGILRAPLKGLALGHDCDATVLCHLQCVGQAGNAAA